jgi:hypothetical protein
VDPVLHGRVASRTEVTDSRHEPAGLRGRSWHVEAGVLADGVLEQLLRVR